MSYLESVDTVRVGGFIEKQELPDGSEEFIGLNNQVGLLEGDVNIAQLYFSFRVGDNFLSFKRQYRTDGEVKEVLKAWNNRTGRITIYNEKL